MDQDTLFFVTLFDSYYMSRGLTLYESLKDHMENFVLYIIAFDQNAYEKLEELHLKNVVLISQREFEDEELLAVKSHRSRGEYCWTSTPKAILYVMEHYHVPMVTYLDADIYFYQSPEILLREMQNTEDVLLTEHRYSPYCDQTATSGIYNVQFMPFKNNENGLQILNWWKEKCLECCCIDTEKGICGDQKYLDGWMQQFGGIHVLQHPGGGVAPWNVDQYTFRIQSNHVILVDKLSRVRYPLIFYHFHNMKIYDKDVVGLTDGMYKIPDTAVTYIYKEYIRKMKLVCEKYQLNINKEVWCNIAHYNSDDLDTLVHDKNYYHFSLF